jgi:hypothetical protein
MYKIIFMDILSRLTPTLPRKEKNKRSPRLSLKKNTRELTRKLLPKKNVPNFSKKKRHHVYMISCIYHKLYFLFHVAVGPSHTRCMHERINRNHPTN